MTTINLFEYQNRADYLDPENALECFLDEIWQKREKSEYWSDEESLQSETQRFIQFLHKDGKIKSNKYAGVIHFNGKTINLLPKIFYTAERQFSEQDIEAIHCHIMWWLSYCSKIKFPNYNTSIGTMKGDLFEILIYLFAKYTRELLKSSIFQQYQEEDRELTFVKGRINTSAYINENIAKGRWHRINCTYELFSIDNKFNRIVKYVSSFLYNATKNDENKKLLRDILFILDEVTFEKSNAEDCRRMRFNPMFSDFEIVRDYCYLFLKNSISYSYKNELNLFAFLIPMEYLFQDFVAGFIKKEIQNVNATAQSKSTLDNEGNFAICPDLILKSDGKTIVADTKYKIIYSDNNDPKKGISQNDLYQMISYAVRLKSTQILLFYPDTFRMYQSEKFCVSVKDEFSKTTIVINAHQVPVIKRDMFNLNAENLTCGLMKMFENCRLQLVQKLNDIIKTS